MWDKYPWNEEKKIKEIIGKYYDIDPQNLLLGFGSDELTNFLFTSYALNTPGFWHPRDINIKDFSYPMLMQYVENFNYILSDDADLEHWTVRDIKTLQEADICLRKKHLWLDFTHLEEKALMQKAIKELHFNEVRNQNKKIHEIQFQRIIIGSFSKKPFNIPGLRLGFLYSDKNMIHFLQKYRSGFSIHGETYKTIKEVLNENF